jgi:hypothetical protein
VKSLEPYNSTNILDVPSSPIFIRARLALNGRIFIGHWLELGRDDFPIFDEDQWQIRVWYDASCKPTSHPDEVEELRNHVDAYIDALYADIYITDASTELLEYLKLDQSGWGAPDELFEEYGGLAIRLYDTIFHRANRLIQWFRAEKGQYWLEEFRAHPVKRLNSVPAGYAHVDNLQAWINGTKFEWAPPEQALFIERLPADRGLSICDIRKAWEFAKSESRPNLALELLTSSEQLATEGHNRVALTQAATALEMSLSTLGKGFMTRRMSASNLRLATTSFYSIQKRLGLTATVEYLLPLLFSESEIPTNIIRTCSKAIAERNNVIHNGQRDVEHINDYIQAIRSLCSNLSLMQEKFSETTSE